MFPVNGDGTDRHVHTFAGITSLADGHHHHVEGVTGPAIPLEDGRHYHLIYGRTFFEPLIHKGNLHIIRSIIQDMHTFLAEKRGPKLAMSQINEKNSCFSL